jgi:serine/threonine protein kinase
LKVLHEVDDNLDARFRNEAKLAARLVHRNIVRVFDFIEEKDGTLVLVMELLRGESLARYLERKSTLEVREAVAIALAVLSALGHAHGAGIVHRDVTPANVFLAVDPDGQVIPKIVDFGIAKRPAAASLTLDGGVLGTPKYMSPEQIRSAAGVDGRSDLFSVAVILYEMLVGASPFAASTPAASLAAVLEATVDPDPRIPPRLWVELSRALSKRPYERHASAAELADAVRAASGEVEEALALALRRNPSERFDWDVIDEDPGRPHAALTIGGHSMGPRRAWQDRRWRVGAAAGLALAAVGLVVAAVTSVRHAGVSNAPPRLVAPTTSLVVPASETGQAAGVMSAPDPAARSSPSTSAAPAASWSPPPSLSTGGRRRPSPGPPSRPRPVATTPGF